MKPILWRLRNLLQRFDTYKIRFSKGDLSSLIPPSVVTTSVEITLYYRFLQKNGLSKIKTVNSSSLPKSIKKAHHHLAAEGIP